MTDKRRVRKSIKQLQRVKTWQLVILLVLMAFISATLLRMNNVGMIQRREAVLAADKQGVASQTRQRLFDLQRYATAHMNADTGTFYLQDQYNRDAQAAIEASSQQSTANATLNAQAEAVCKPRFSGYSQGYLQCFVAELSKNPGSETLPEPELPSPALYRYEFASPLWSPDTAGFSLLLCFGIVLVIFGRLVSLAVLQAMLKKRYHDS